MVDFSNSYNQLASNSEEAVEAAFKFLSRQGNIRSEVKVVNLVVNKLSQLNADQLTEDMVEVVVRNPCEAFISIYFNLLDVGQLSAKIRAV